MSFYREQKYLQEQSREVRQVKKLLPYTVTPINDIDQWKAEQAIKQEKWDNGRAERYAKARQRAIEVLEGKAATHDYQAEIEKQYNERRAAMVKEVCRPEIKQTSKSLFNNLWNKLLNFFLNLKF